MKKLLSIASCFLMTAAVLITASSCKDKEKNTVTAKVMAIHAVRDLGNIDFYAQNELREDNIEYGKESYYYDVKRNESDFFSPVIKAYKTDYALGTVNDPAWTGNAQYSVILFGSPNNIKCVSVPDNYTIPANGRTQVRFINLSPDSLTLDVYLNGELFAKDRAPYSKTLLTSATPFTDIHQDTYEIALVNSKTNSTVYKMKDVKFEQHKVYTFYAAGLRASEKGISIGIAQHIKK